MRKAFRYIAVLTALGLIGCSSDLRPVDIENGDMCSFCRMAISEKQFAAEMITAEESVLKFDDVGCLLRYLKARADAPNAAAIYVADSDNKKWLKAEDAFFVRSTTVKTPMGSGIIAFASAEKAGTGSVRFSELQAK